MDATTPTTAASLAAIAEKLDRLTDQVDYLTRRQRAWDELREDLAPVVNDGYQVVVEELSGLDGALSTDALARLFRQLLSSVETLSETIDRLNSLNDLLGDVRPLGREALTATIERLDDLEKRGYWEFLKALTQVGDRVVGAFGPDDVHQLGEHIVEILTTTRNVTQRDVLRLVNNTVSGLRDTPAPAPKGLFGLMRALRDPDVRRGVGLMLHALKRLAAESEHNGDDAAAKQLEGPAQPG